MLSIIIISYENSSLVLRRAIQSVLGQSYSNCEIILVDANEEGSDYSLGLREDMEAYPQIPVLPCPSQKGGFAAAKNLGASRADGTYLAFLMAGDAWNQECASSQIEVLREREEVALVFCQSWQQEEDALSTRYRNAPAPALMAETGGALVPEAIQSVSQVMFRRSVFDDMLGFDTKIHRQDDYDMWLRVARKNKIASIDQNLVCSYVDKGVIKKTHKLIDVVGYLQLYSKHRGVYRKNPSARYELYRRIAACYKEERYYFAWLKYEMKIRMLGMRLGKKKKSGIEAKETMPENCYVKVVCQDAETGNVIPVPGAEFAIMDGNGSRVTMSVTYPEPMTLSTFATGANGYFVTPDRLAYGTYKVSEISAPFGYINDQKDVELVVSKERQEMENGIPVLALEMKNTAQKGRIHIRKSGPVTGKVRTEENTLKNTAGYTVGGPLLYTPYFETGNAAGAVYEIIADENITTGDGTLRAEKDTVVDTVTTDENGSAISAGLYPGRYRVQEKNPCQGLLREEETQDTELVCVENSAEAAETEVSFAGRRRSVSVCVEKTLGEDGIFGIGTKDELKDFAFGLFAAEDILMSDGKVIPRDGLIEILRCGGDGHAQSSADIPYGRYYVKEILSNCHYRRQDTCYPVHYAYSEQDGGEVKLSVNEGRPVVGEVIRGAICGVMTDEHNHPLSMGETGLFHVGTTDFSKDAAILVSVTDWNGLFSFKDIPCGDYIVREVNAPQGFVINEAMYYISLTYDGQRIDLKLINQSMPG